MTTESPWRNRIVRSGRANPATLRANPRNWRTHPEAQRAALTQMLDDVGFVQQVVVNHRTGNLIDGHLRVELAVEQGERSIPVLYVDLSEEEEHRVLAALDPLVGMAGIDTEQLDSLLRSLTIDEGALATMLADLADHAGIELNPREAHADPEHVPEIPKDVYVQPGDIYRLGEHRLMCGDSTSVEDVAFLMDGEKAALFATDPPYLVEYRGGTHPNSKANSVLTKDKQWGDYKDPEISSTFLVDFLRVGLQHCVERVPVYQWHADLRRVEVAEAWAAAGLLVHQVLIWVKARRVLTRSHFMWQHEPALYGWPRGFIPKRKPPANASTVWTIDQVGEQDGIHPTQKPLEIFTRPIEYHTSRGDICYEPFSGSGTQIIAAEQLRRRCFAMDIAPAFVQVGIERWEQFTGQKAERIRRKK